MIVENHADDTSDPDTDDESELATIDARSRNKALTEFRFRVEEAISGDYLFANKWNKTTETAPADASLWGAPLVRGNDATDGVLSKFLKAKRYKVPEALAAIRKTLKWRAEFRPETEVAPLDNAWFSSGVDREGRPLCYNVLGKEYQRCLLSLGDQQSYSDHLKWRVACVEKGIRNLNFTSGGPDSIVQIIDLRNAAGLASKEMKVIGKKLITLLHHHYPAIIHKNLIINVPSWFLTINALNLRIITKRSKNKFIFVKPSRVTETLVKYVSIENILAEYGGLRRENDDMELKWEDKATEVSIRASGTELIRIPVNQGGVTLTWDITVMGYEVTYKEEFVPDDEGSYKIVLQEKKMGETTRNSFYIREPGKIVISIANHSYTKKKAFYRYCRT